MLILVCHLLFQVSAEALIDPKLTATAQRELYSCLNSYRVPSTRDLDKRTIVIPEGDALHQPLWITARIEKKAAVHAFAAGTASAPTRTPGL